MNFSKNPISRRIVLAAAAAGGMLRASTLAQAQTGEQVLEPRRPGRGGSNPGPKNPGRIQQNPDIISPPATDRGTLPNLRFSFDDSHMRLEPGGWTRQVTVRELGISKNIAGVNMRLNAGGVPRAALAQGRRMVLHAHWHGAYHRDRRRGTEFRGRRRRRRPVVLPARHSAFEFRASIRTAANFYWCLTMVISTRTTRFFLVTGSSTPRPMCWRKTLAFPLAETTKSIPQEQTV